MGQREKTGTWGVNTQEPLQLQTKLAEPPALGNLARPERSQNSKGEALLPLSASWTLGAFLGLGCQCEGLEGHMDLDSPSLDAGQAGLAPCRRPAAKAAGLREPGCLHPPTSDPPHPGSLAHTGLTNPHKSGQLFPNAALGRPWMWLPSAG